MLCMKSIFPTYPPNIISVHSRTISGNSKFHGLSQQCFVTSLALSNLLSEHLSPHCQGRPQLSNHTNQICTIMLAASAIYVEIKQQAIISVSTFTYPNVKPQHFTGATIYCSSTDLPSINYCLI